MLVSHDLLLLLLRCVRHILAALEVTIIVKGIVVLLTGAGVATLNEYTECSGEVDDVSLMVLPIQICVISDRIVEDVRVILCPVSLIRCESIKE